MPNKPNINFEKCLSKGHASYNTEVGEWWRKQAEDRSHKRAYKTIAHYLFKCLKSQKCDPKILVDYACGDGSFLLELANKFPQSKIIGLDGSDLMLEYANKKLTDKKIKADLCSKSKCFDSQGPQVRLVKTVLPNFFLPQKRADAVIYLFPNITCSDKERQIYDSHGYRNRKDVQVAERLARFREMDPEDEVVTMSPDELFDDLMTAKVLSRNLRQLVKRGGYHLRIEYANAPREQLSNLTNWRSLFCEGALDLPIKEYRSEMIFKFIKSRYWRSKVILDVYHQTDDETDLNGGYFCSFFKAV